MRRAVYPGSFDPITNGHLDIVARCAGLFDELIVAVLHNPAKRPLFSVEERVRLIEAVVAPFRNVRVDRFMGLLVDYVRRTQAAAVIRGVREVADFETEVRMAQMNRHLYDPAVTLLVPTHPHYGYISSSLVKEVAAYGGDVAGLVPPVIAEALREKMRNAGPE
jgi:pantetheine-phosphate adenylyltransferase